MRQNYRVPNPEDGTIVVDFDETSMTEFREPLGYIIDGIRVHMSRRGFMEVYYGGPEHIEPWACPFGHGIFAQRVIVISWGSHLDPPEWDFVDEDGGLCPACREELEPVPASAGYAD